MPWWENTGYDVPMNRSNSILECKQCGYTWFREFSVRAENPKPLRCPSKKCRSRHWDTEYTRPAEADRFLSFIEMTDGCWLWRGAITNVGYGRFRMNGGGSTNISAHRYSFLHFVGPIPDGHHIHHRCRNRACVNPAHLELTLIHDHQGKHSRTPRTACNRGHPYDEANTLTYRGRRWCRTCNRLRARWRYARWKAAVNSPTAWNKPRRTK